MWAVVLLIAFFANRGADAGRIGQLVSNLGGGPFFGSGIFESFIGAVVAALIAASWFGLGSVVVSRIELPQSSEHSHILELALKTAVGAAVWSLIWFALGTAGLYTGWAAFGSLVAGFVVTLFGLRRLREARKESKVPERAGRVDKLLLILITIPMALSFVASLAPPTSKDTLLYHFAVPKTFVLQGSNAFIEGNIASYLALGTEMHTVWAMLLGGAVNERAGEAAGGAVVWAFFPLLLAVIFGFAREAGVERRWALIATLMVATVPTAYHVAASAYTDLALAVFVTLAVYSLTRWWKTPQTGWLILIAIFLGAGLSAKLTTLFVIAAFALVILLRVRKAQETDPDRIGTIAIGGLAALLLAGVIASPWYLRTWVETGSPVFPFYMNIWPAEAPGWDAERSQLFQLMNAQYGGDPKTVVDYVAAPWNISIVAQPEFASHFDGVLGIAFLIGLPLMIFGLWKFELRIEAKICIGVAVVMFLFWLFSSQQLRYLLPLLPITAVAIAAAITAMSQRSDTLRAAARYSLTAAAVAGIVVSAAWFLNKAPVRVVLGGETRDDYLTRNIDYYPYYHWLNTETEPEAKVWLINMRRDTYHLQRPHVSDYLFEDWTLRQLVWESRNEQELRAKAAAMGVQYILTRHDVLFDPQRSTLIDDARPKAENDGKLQMAKALLADPARTVRADKRFSLVKVF